MKFREHRDEANYYSPALEAAVKIFPPIWTIYDHPLDYPEHYIVRIWFGECPHPTAARCDTLDLARELVQTAGGVVCLGRLPDDDPKVVESWI